MDAIHDWFQPVLSGPIQRTTRETDRHKNKHNSTTLHYKFDDLNKQFR